MGTSVSSGVLSADTLIATGRNRVNAITVFSDGINEATLELYDNTSAAGTVNVKGICLAVNKVSHLIFENPVKFENGIYANVTGTGASFIVYFGG